MNKTYSVDLVRYIILDRKTVNAMTKEEAKDKAMTRFNSYDLNDYDDIWVEEQDYEEDYDEDN